MESNNQSFVKSEKIYNEIIKNLYTADCIHLYGEEGTGKTHLCKRIVDTLKEWENWSVYYMCGTSKDVEPYSTICDAKGVNKSIAKVTVNLGISQIINAGVSVTSDKGIGFLPNEYSFVRELLNHVEEDVLIVADNYHLWDDSSIKLLNTLIKNENIKTDLQKRIHVIIVTDTEHKNLVSFCKVLPKYEMPITTNDDVRFFIKNEMSNDIANEVSETIIDYLRIITGGNLNLIKLIIEGCQNNIDNLLNIETGNITINSITEYRIEEFNKSISKESFSAKKILGIAALIDESFTLEKLCYISEQTEPNLISVLTAAEKYSLIKDIPPYMFACSQIKKWLEQEYKAYKGYYSKREYSLLCEKHPENYLQRAVCLSKCSEYDPEVIHLFMMAYSRAALIFLDENACNDIFKKVEKYVSDKNNYHDLITANEDFLNFKDIIIKIKNNEIDEAFEQISCGFYAENILVISELYLLKLYCLTYDKNPDSSIREVIEDLLDVLNILKIKNEFEQYVRCLLCILPIIIDKLNDLDLFETLRNDLNSILLQHTKKNKFLEYAQATLKRKSSLYRSSDTAYSYSQQAVHFFTREGMEADSYYALCNHSGNLILRNDYAKAIDSANEAIKISNMNPQLPLKEKVINNLIIAKLLRDESEYKNGNLSNAELEMQVRNYIGQISECINNSRGDTRNVLIMNRCSLLAYIGLFDEAELAIQRFEEQLELYDCNDDFYSYHLNSIKLGISIVSGKWDEASYLLSRLQTAPSLFHKDQRLIKKKNEILHNIIQKEARYSSTEYNFAVVSELPKFSNVSWLFYSRGFPISDIQFNSI